MRTRHTSSLLKIRKVTITYWSGVDNRIWNEGLMKGKALGAAFMDSGRRSRPQGI